MVDAPHLARAKAVSSLRAGITAMKYRPLGNTGVRVSQLGLGTMPFGDDTDEDEAGAIVAACLDVGINMFDCADVYTDGRAETILGRLIAPVRDDVVLATKVGFPSGEGVNRRGASPAHVRLSVEDSLARLGTDRIDLYYLHRFDRHTDIDHTLRTLDALVTAGKILHIGVSNFAAWQVATALGRCALNGWAPIVALQPMYNLVKRQAEVELLPLAHVGRSGRVPVQPARRGTADGQVRHARLAPVRAGWSPTRCTARATATRAASSPQQISPRSPPRSVATRRRSPSPGSVATRE